MFNKQLEYISIPEVLEELKIRLTARINYFMEHLKYIGAIERQEIDESSISEYFNDVFSFQIPKNYNVKQVLTNLKANVTDKIYYYICLKSVLSKNNQDHILSLLKILIEYELIYSKKKYQNCNFKVCFYLR